MITSDDVLKALSLALTEAGIETVEDAAAVFADLGKVAKTKRLQGEIAAKQRELNQLQG